MHAEDRTEYCRSSEFFAWDPERNAMTSDARIIVEQEEAGRFLVKLEGPLNIESAPEARRKLLKLVGKRRGEMLLDLSMTTDIDTAGIAVAVEIARAMRRQGGRLSVTGLNERARRLIRLANLDSVFERRAS